jgi:DNA-binding beta-propeller fold protein YncE
VIRRVGLIVAVAAAASGCGAGSGLHVEDGGRTVPLRSVDRPRAPVAPPVAAPAPGTRLGGPAVLAYADGTLWCAVQPDGAALVGSLVRVSTASGKRAGAPIPLPPAARPYLLAVGADGVWLAAGVHLWRIGTGAGSTGLDTRLDGRATALADAGGSVWATVATAAGGRIERIDPGTGAKVAEAPVGPAPSALTVAGGSAWVTDSADQSITRLAIAPAGLRRTAAIPLPRSRVRAPTQITVYAGRVWVYERGRVLRIDPATNRVAGTTRLAPAPGGTLAAGSGGVWVITRTRRRHLGAVRLLAPDTGAAVGHRIVIGGRPTGIVTDGRAAWVFDADADRLVRLSH